MTVAAPFLVSYSVTSRCNLACRHCYSQSTEASGGEDLATGESLMVVDSLADWQIGLLIFDGGEPLCRSDFLDIAAYASSRGLRTVMGSNGTMIDRSTARKLRDAGIRSVAISLDAGDAETHDWFRGKEGAFKEALAGAESCKGEGLAFQFNMVLRKATLNQIPEMLRLAAEFGADAVELFDLVLAGRAKDKCQDDVLNKTERRDVMEWLAEAQAEYPLVIRVPACPMYPLILKRKEVRPRYVPVELLARIPYYRRGCAAGMPSGYLVIRSNGELNPCMLLQINLGNAKEEDIKQLWQNSPILARLRDRSLLKGACGDCEYNAACAGCRGRAHEEAGDMLASDPGCWMH